MATYQDLIDAHGERAVMRGLAAYIRAVWIVDFRNHLDVSAYLHGSISMARDHVKDMQDGNLSKITPAPEIQTCIETRAWLELDWMQHIVNRWHQ